MKKTKLLTAVKYILFLVVGVVIVFYLFESYYTPSFISNFESVSLKWLSVSIVCGFLAHVFRALRWQLMIVPLAKKAPRFINVFNALMIGYLVNLGLPRAGELARCAWVAKKEGIDTAKLIGSVIAERVFDLLMLLLLVLISLYFYRDLFANFLPANLSELIQQKLTLIAIAGVLTLSVLVLLVVLYKRKHRFFETLKSVLLKLWTGFLIVKNIERKFSFALFTLLIWFFYIGSSYFAFKMLAQTELLTFMDALLSVVAASFGMIAPIQGGIGAFHFMVTKCLMLLNVADTPALVFATVLHASQTLLTAFLGLVAFVSDFWFSRTKQTNR